MIFAAVTTVLLIQEITQSLLWGVVDEVQSALVAVVCRIKRLATGRRVPVPKCLKISAAALAAANNGSFGFVQGNLHVCLPC